MMKQKEKSIEERAKEADRYSTIALVVAILTLFVNIVQAYLILQL